jgi:hypothetical protein
MTNHRYTAPILLASFALICDSLRRDFGAAGALAHPLRGAER